MMTMPFGPKPFHTGYGIPYSTAQPMQPFQHMPYTPYYGPAATAVPSPAMVPPPIPSGAGITPAGVPIVTPPVEESYVENILRLNRGKMATFYMTYENNREWNAKVFKGIIEAAGRDHIIISDPATGMRHLLLMLNLDFVTFDEAD